MFRNALLVRRVSKAFLKSPSVQKFSFSSQKTKNLSELSSQEAATLLNSLNVMDHKMDGMCLSHVKNQSNIVKTNEETNEDSTSLLPGFTFFDSWKPKTANEVARHPSVKKGDLIQLGSVFKSGIIN
jgi:hypothetical protein